MIAYGELFVLVLSASEGKNGRVIDVTEPQVWVLIGIFGAAMFSIIGVQTASFNRNLTTSISALKDSMEGRFEALHGELNGFKGEVNARFDAVNARIDVTNSKIDGLDRDVQALTHRVFGADNS